MSKPLNFDFQYTKIFKIVNPKTFDKSLNSVHYPQNIRKYLKFYTKDILKRKNILNL